MARRNLRYDRLRARLGGPYRHPDRDRAAGALHRPSGAGLNMDGTSAGLLIVVVGLGVTGILLWVRNHVRDRYAEAEPEGDDDE